MDMTNLKTTLEKHKKILYILGGLVVCGFIANSLYNTFHKEPIVKEVPVVRTVTIGESNTEDTYTYPGEVKGKYQSNLAFQVGGKIVTRNINLGDSVTAGEVLMTIDPKDVEQSTNLYQAAVNSAESNYKLAHDNYNRYASLYNAGAVSAMVRDQYKTQLEAAESTLQQARAQLQVSLNQLNYTKLVADHSGVISSINGEIGMVVAAGSPVVTIVQDGDRQIEISVPEGRLDSIHPGQSCNVTFWALNNVSTTGTIAEIAPMADQSTKTYKVKVTLNNMPAEARLGMTAKVSLTGENKGTEILIPRSAIYGTTGSPKVWIIKDNKATLRDVTAAGYKDDQVIITKGLEKGDIVVTAGVTKLSDNMEVKLEGGASK